MKIIFILLLFFTIPAIAQPPDSLEQELKKAQVAYYEGQTARKTFLQTISAALPGVIGTMIGASLALLGVRWSNRRLWQLEREKWETAKRDERAKEIRTAAAELSKVIAAGLQSIVWLTWIGKYEPHSLTDKEIDDYNMDMKQAFRDSIVAQAYLATLNVELNQKMKVIAKEVFRIDHHMASELQTIKGIADVNKRATAAVVLAAYYDEANAIHEGLPERIGEALASIQQ